METGKNINPQSAPEMPHTDCNHPLLHPEIVKSMHTGNYFCIKCGKGVRDTHGLMIFKELNF